MSNSKKRCLGCKKYFPSESMIYSPVGLFHDMDCRLIYATKNSKKLAEKGRKIQRADTRKKKEALRDRSWYVKECQKWFNKFIRLRDKDLPCICCGRDADADIQWHAGHLLTTGARPEHRFNELNCHKQTSYCNNYLSGNVAEYRKRLILKIGLKAVEEMESDHEPKKYTIDELKGLIKTYKAKCKEMENND